MDEEEASTSEPSADLEAVTNTCDLTDLGCHLSSFGSWLLEAVLYVPRAIWRWMLESLGAIVEVVVKSAADLFPLADLAAALPSGLGYLGDIFAVPEGLVLLSGTLFARFFLRRIPIVG